jgi:hypothetical protein
MKTLDMQAKILPPNPARLIEGLRDTGYDFNTALCDIIDNSIDAGATKIDIILELDGDGEIFIAIADNGCGMDHQTLLDGMTYGSQGKSDPKRLGKFGLGLKTASTAFSKKLSVVSRDSHNSIASKAVWDLDHVIATGQWELLIGPPLPYELELLQNTAEAGSGTLVVWEKVDRLLKKNKGNNRDMRKLLEKVINNFIDHSSMVFQRFLDTIDSRARNINITINKNNIEPWDPFCQSEAYTELVAEKTVEAEMPDGKKIDFIIKAFVLPRKEDFSTPEAHKRARLSNNMQGMYVYRENRLIHPADWMGMFSKDPHLTLLRVEFSFDHGLDEAFQVDIKKSQIILDDELYNYVLNEFIPAPRNAANERYRMGQRTQIQSTSENAHKSSNRSISGKADEVSNSQVNILNGGTGDVEVTNSKGSVRLKLNVTNTISTEGIYVQPVSTINDGLLWEPALHNQCHAVNINTGHPYYHKVYYPNLSSHVIVQGMDSLLWALSEAELGTVNEATKTHFRELRYEVSRILRKLVEDLPEPNLS